MDIHTQQWATEEYEQVARKAANSPSSPSWDTHENSQAEWFHADMLTLFKRFLIKEKMSSLQKMRMVMSTSSSCVTSYEKLLRKHRETHREWEREKHTHTQESLKTTKHTNQPNGKQTNKQTNKQANSWKLEPATIVQGSWSRGCRDGSQISCSSGEGRREQGSKEKPNFQGELWER